jgi:hypothetical protein
LVGEDVWVSQNLIRPRLSRDELWMLYRLVDNQYWLLRKHPHPFWDLEKLSRLRLKLLRDLNRNRKQEYQISARRRVY